MIEVKLASEEEVLNARGRWNQLVSSMQRPSVYCSWEWITQWIELYKMDYQIKILYLFEDNDLNCILPLAIKKLTIEDGVLPCKALIYCGNLELCSDHIDIIADDARTREYIPALFDFIYHELDWDVMHLSHLGEDSRILEWLEHGKTSIDFTHKTVSEAQYIDVKESTYEDYSKSLRGHTRREVNRVARKLNEKHVVELTRYTPESTDSTVDELFRLHNKRAASVNVASSFTTERNMAFHRAIIPVFYKNDWVRLWFLKVDGKPVATNYVFQFKGRYFGYQQGLDPEWERASVGRVLMNEVIKKSFEERVTEFDFSRGEGRHKSIWTDSARDLITVNIYNASPVARLHKIINLVRDFLANVVKSRIARCL